MTTKATGVEPLWTKREVAEYLRCSVSWVEKAAARGNLPSCPRTSRMLRFDPEAIRAYARGEHRRRARVHPLPVKTGGGGTATEP